MVESLFLEVDLIENCIEYMYAHAKNKVIKFSVTTNGTLFNERIIRLLKKYPFNVLISLDGPKEIHDKNRVFANGKGSYDVLMKNLTQIRLSEPDLYNQFSYNMVMDPTVEYACVQDFVKECHDLDTNKFSFSDISTQYQKDPSFFAKISIRPHQRELIVCNLKLQICISNITIQLYEHSVIFTARESPSRRPLYTR